MANGNMFPAKYRNGLQAIRLSHHDDKTRTILSEHAGARMEIHFYQWVLPSA
jgi:hypothetical protein